MNKLYRFALKRLRRLGAKTDRESILVYLTNFCGQGRKDNDRAAERLAQRGFLVFVAKRSRVVHEDCFTVRNRTAKDGPIPDTVPASKRFLHTPLREKRQAMPVNADATLAFTSPHFPDNFSEFFQGVLRGALFSEVIHAPGSSYHEQPFDAHFSPQDIAVPALLRLQADALTFFWRAHPFLGKSVELKEGGGIDPWCHAGVDYWLTRNSHGAGFWDGDWPTYGAMFTKLSKSMGCLRLDLVFPDSPDDKILIYVCSA